MPVIMKTLRSTLVSNILMIFPLLALIASNILPGLLIILGLGSIDRSICIKPHVSMLLWLIFMTGALISSIFAQSPAVALSEWCRVVGMMLFCYISMQWVAQSKYTDWQKLVSGFKISWLIAVIFFAAEFISGGKIGQSFINMDINFFNKGACVLATGVWLCLFVVRYDGNGVNKEWLGSILVYLLVSALVYSMESEAAMVGLIMSTMVFIFAIVYPGFYKPLAAFVALGFIALPVIIYLYAFYYIDAIPYELRHSWDHRIYIAFNSISLILEKLPLGWGFGASKILHGMGQGYIVMTEADNGHHLIFNFHPHNSSLQVLLETGVVGLIMYSIAWVGTIISIGKSREISPTLKPYLYAIGCCYIIIGQLNFSAWASWWLSLILLYVIIATSLNKWSMARG